MINLKKVFWKYTKSSNMRPLWNKRFNGPKDQKLISDPYQIEAVRWEKGPKINKRGGSFIR